MVCMTKTDAIKHYGSQAKLGAALGLAQTTVSSWSIVPAIHQLRLQKLTRGKLKADIDALTPKGKA